MFSSRRRGRTARLFDHLESTTVLNGISYFEGYTVIHDLGVIVRVNTDRKNTAMFSPEHEDLNLKL